MAQTLNDGGTAPAGFVPDPYLPVGTTGWMPNPYAPPPTSPPPTTQYPTAAPTPAPAPVVAPTVPEGGTAPDFFAPLARATGTQLSGALRSNPQSPTSSSAAISGLAALGSSPAASYVYGGPSGLAGPSNFSLFDSNPLVAYARAQEAQGITSLDGWLKSQQDLANAQGGTAKERLKRQRELAHRALINRLAARGILRSGDLGYQEGQQAQNFSDSSYDIEQNVLQQLAGYWQKYLEQKNALRGVVDNAMTTAYQNQVQPQNLPTNTNPDGSNVFAPTADANLASIDQYLWRNRR